MSDFPEFAQYVTALAGFRSKMERFWVAGTFQDDLGLRVAGAFGKVYQTREEVAIILANLTHEAAHASFELDSRRYGIATATYSTSSSSQREDGGTAEKAGAVLKGKRSLGPYEVIAAVFRRGAGLA